MYSVLSSKLGPSLLNISDILSLTKMESDNKYIQTNQVHSKETNVKTIETSK